MSSSETKTNVFIEKHLNSLFTFQICFLFQITLYDHSTLNAEHVLDAHTGTLSDFDIDGNLLVTCGYSNRYF